MLSNPFHVVKRRKSGESGDDSKVQSSVAPSFSVPDTPRYGLTKLVEGVNPTFDIVAVHGLDGKRDKSWTAKNGVNWLRDLLPLDIPQARIFSWGYEAKTHSTSAIKSQTLYDHARNLVSDLCRARRITETQRRPIVFVAHSLGGIVIKSALIHSDATRAGALQDHHSIKLSTYGIVFMGTPHQGSEGVDLQTLALRAAKVVMSTDTGILMHLKRDSGWLRQQHGQYEPIGGEFVTIFAYETVPTVGKMTVVLQDSAVLPGIPDAEAIAIPADHVNMVKFPSREDKVYQMVSGHLLTLGQDAPGRISARWEQHDRFVRGNVEMDFSLPCSFSEFPDAHTFVGREKELADIREALQGDASRRYVVVLQGLGGIGKTQLAVEYLKRNAGNYSAIIWLDGKTEDSLRKSFALTARRLHKCHAGLEKLRTAVVSEDIADTLAAMKDWLSIKGNHRWLIVFDNVDNPELLDVEDQQAYDVQAYFPETHQGSIIVTTRSSRLEVGKVISVSKLSNQESIEILSSTSGRAGLDQDPHAQELANELDGLPLALATAGTYLSLVPITLDIYLRKYRASWRTLQMQSPKLLSYQDRTLYSTWNVSLKHVEMQSKSAGQLLRLLGYFDNHDIWYELLAAGGKRSHEWFSTIVEDEINFDEATSILSEHNLIESNKDTGGYAMHSCVHAWVVHVLNGKKDTSMARIAVRCIGLSVPDENTPRYWEVERRLLPHAQKCLEPAYSAISIEMRDDEIYLEALQRLGKLYLNQGRMTESQIVHQRALDGIEKIFGPKHPSTLATVKNLAVLYKIQGKMVEAEATYRRVLDGCEKMLGPDDTTSLLDTVQNLGDLYKEQGEMVQAEAMYQRALEGKEEALGLEHTSTLETVHILGGLYSNQGKMVEAEVMYQRALEGFEKLLGLGHSSPLNTALNLGNLSIQKGKMKEAENKYQRVLGWKEKAWRPDDISTLITVNHLADLYKDLGRMMEAEATYQRCLKGKEKAYGPEHPSTLDTVNKLAILYRDQSKTVEAEAMFQRALEGKEKTLGLGHISTLETVLNLALLHITSGANEEAAVLLERAVSGFEKTLGPHHRSTLLAAQNLADLHRTEGRIEEARMISVRYAIVPC